jgi:hypothetical protein
MSDGWAGFLIFLVIWNATKIPYYLKDIPNVPASPQITVTLSQGKFKGARMRSDPWFFLTIHTVLGCVVLALWAAILLDPASISSRTATFFFLMSAAFALHIWPERSGLPNRIFHKPINEIAVFIVLFGCIMGLAGCGQGRFDMILTGFNIVGGMSVVAPVLEVAELAFNIFVYAKKGEPRDVDKGKDLGFNQEGWYKMRGKFGIKCPWAAGGAAASSAAV